MASSVATLGSSAELRGFALRSADMVRHHSFISFVDRTTMTIEKQKYKSATQVKPINDMQLGQ